jgi:hypothetical protein
MSRLQRIELLLFLTCWFAFAYFNQGGGWNQNSRFAEIRAMAESGRFAIDDFLVYRPVGEEGRRSEVPLERAEYVEGGKRHRLCWVDGTWTFYPVGITQWRKVPRKRRCTWFVRPVTSAMCRTPVTFIRTSHPEPRLRPARVLRDQSHRARHRE